ncbi:MAG: (2Fe-2S) ferredoxin domain-containing protein [Hydrococcus sp. RU_2_2]|nr:(2Fe-2S) ferredoxin domain-containing protein [Hydrococcus sp. RU_2_2]NJP20521.1 (2Fe-2S) ferredoxin domain-containing protein [Hydrococcus sp. CRU_1_1]
MLGTMNSPQYRVFVCTKQRPANAPEGCCCNVGALEIYQAFQAEIDKRQLGDRIEVRRSGCLDCCEAGAIALVYRPHQNEFSWLPTKLRLKLRRWFVPQRCLYGHLTRADIPAIVESHFIKGQALKRCQISTN